MSSKKYDINPDGSITFHDADPDDKTRQKAADEVAGQREKATDVADDVEVRETAEGKTEREKAGA